MKRFLLNFVGCFVVCLLLIALVFLMNVTTGYRRELWHYLQGDRLPLSVLSVVGVSALMALIYTVISGLISKPK